MTSYSPDQTDARLRPGRDTDAASAAMQLAAIRRVPPADRLRDALELSELIRGIALQKLAARHPGLSPRELTERFLAEGVGRMVADE
ncbi:MAG TPA: hypothetical protein VGM77_07050 [Gemmatimonadales bacterium]|jgi:hypothetical protein